MNKPAVEKQVVLVGAGNAHLVFLKKWRMKPVAGVSVVLVNESAEMPYSAMVPGLLAGEYWPSQVMVDLVSFCASAGVRLIYDDRVTSIDLDARHVILANRKTPLPFSFLSLNVGNIAPEAGAAPGKIFSLRPLASFLGRLPELDFIARQGKKIAIAGAGPSGCEVALALANRYRDTTATVHLYEGADRALPQFPANAGAWFQRRLRKQQVALFTQRPLGQTGYGEFDAVILATSPAPESWFTASGIACDERGFVKVAATLQSVSHEFVFAAGDVAAVQGVAPFAKNGVYSVRMGQTLFKSISAALQSQPFPKFRPQKKYLALLNGGEGKGLLAYGGLILKGRWTRKLKHRIDEAWMRNFATPEMETEPMRCLGCAAKVPGGTLKDSLDALKLADREDCAIEVHADDQKVTLKSVDFLSLFLDDPYTFGKIAALHSVSDLYAMNGVPKTALALLTIPWASEPLQKQWISEVMGGAAEIAAQEGFEINGGHTGEAERISFGLSVSGEADKAKLFLKHQLRPGDHLVITKRLGIGTLLAAWMRSIATAPEMKEGIAEMLKSNRLAREMFNEAGVIAATDVTGFGVAGSLAEMAQKSGVTVRFSDAVGFELDSYKRLSELGITSTLFPENKKYQTALPGALPDCFFDPQTSGGLLGAIPEANWDAFQKRAHDAGLFYAAIGRVASR